MPVKNGDKVKVEYTGTLDDGTVFDSSKTHDQLLQFEVGSHEVIAGFENAVVGMEQGQEKKITIQPADGYGDRNQQMVQKVPRDALPKEQEPTVGMTLIMGLPTGERFPVTITAVSGAEVTLDMNHPLAGKVLHFRIKVVEIKT